MSRAGKCHTAIRTFQTGIKAMKRSDAKGLLRSEMRYKRRGSGDEAWHQEGHKGRRSYSVVDTAQPVSRFLWPQWSDMQHLLRTQHPRQSIYLNPEVAFHIRKHLRPAPPTSGRDIQERPGPSPLLAHARRLLRLDGNPLMKKSFLLHAELQILECISPPYAFRPLHQSRGV